MKSAADNGIVFGPVIARSLILHTAAKWRWSYYLGIIMSVISLILYQLSYHPPTYKQLHVQGKTKRQQMAELDYGGMFLFISGMVLFLIGLSWGGTTYNWGSPQVLCALVIGIATLVAFVLYGRFWRGLLLPTIIFLSRGYAESEQKLSSSSMQLLSQCDSSRISATSPSSHVLQSEQWSITP